MNVLLHLLQFCLNTCFTKRLHTRNGIKNIHVYGFIQVIPTGNIDCGVMVPYFVPQVFFLMSSHRYEPISRSASH